MTDGEALAIYDKVFGDRDSLDATEALSLINDMRRVVAAPYIKTAVQILAEQGYGAPYLAAEVRDAAGCAPKCCCRYAAAMEAMEKWGLSNHFEKQSDNRTRVYHANLPDLCVEGESLLAAIEAAAEWLEEKAKTPDAAYWSPEDPRWADVAGGE